MTKKSNAGARCKITPEMTKSFMEAVKLGLTNRAACDYAGISEAAFYNYLNWAERDIGLGKQSPYVEFFEALKKAKAQFRAYHMNNIRKASEGGQWQASAWTLERCCPDEYGRTVKNEVSIEMNESKKMLGDYLNVVKGKSDN